MSSLIASATGKNVFTCSLCYRRILEAPPLNVPLDGDLSKAALKVQDKLLDHLKQFHQQEVMQAVGIAQGFLPFLIWNAFRHEDESIPPMLEAIRRPIFAMVRKTTLSDESLQHIVATLGLDPDDAKKTFEAMKAVHDACCELNQQTPQPVEPSRIHRVDRSVLEN